MKTKELFAVISYSLLFLLMSSCSSERTPVKVDVISNIEGSFIDNIDVVSDSAIIGINQNNTGWQIEFSVKLKVVEAIDIEGGYSKGSPFGPIIEYRLFDNNKIPITIGGFRIQSNPDINGIASNLSKQDSEFWIQIFQTFAWEKEKDKVNKMHETLKKAKYVQLTSRIEGSQSISSLSRNKTLNSQIANKPSDAVDRWGLSIPCYVINTTAVKDENQAKSQVDVLTNEGYRAGYFWIPDYNSLSGAEYFSVFIGPFTTIESTAKFVENYRKTNTGAYATLISDEYKRVEIRGKNSIKTTILESPEDEYLGDGGAGPVGKNEDNYTNEESRTSDDCNKFLKGYEEYITDYVEILKKQQKDPSDITVLTKLSQISIKATEWADKVEACQNDPDFYKKYLKLSEKLSRAMSGIYEDTYSNKKSSTSNSSNDCDKFLKGYEEYITDYIKVLKKQQKDPSDITVLTELSQLSIKATEWADKVEGCQNDPGFNKKYLKLSEKLANAMRGIN